MLQPREKSPDIVLSVDDESFGDEEYRNQFRLTLIRGVGSKFSTPRLALLTLAPVLLSCFFTETRRRPISGATSFHT